MNPNRIKRGAQNEGLSLRPPAAPPSLKHSETEGNLIIVGMEVGYMAKAGDQSQNTFI